MRYLPAIILILSCGQALASGTYLHTGAWSKHFSDDAYNESHSLLAVEYRSYMAGYFRNSYGEDSVFAAKRWSWSHGNWEAGIAVGAVYGYRHCFKGWADRSRRVCPLVSPSLTYTKYAIQPSVLVMGNAAALSVRTNLDALFGGSQ